MAKACLSNQLTELVPAGGFLSDESDYYGSSPDTSTTGSDSYFQQHDRLPTVVANNAAASSTSAQALHNRFQGRSAHGKQLEESVDAFVARLPPSNAFAERDVVDEHTSAGDNAWIWCDNPRIDPRQEKDQDVGGFLRAGREALYQYLDLKSELASELHQSKKSHDLGKQLSQPRAELVERLKKLAGQYHVTSGKWMIFCTPDRVDKIWKRVCEGVVDGRLGGSAKVARRRPKEDGTARDFHQREEQVICIYTRDFEDEEDVKRVLFALRDLGLVSRDDARGVWYKTDAWTFLDIKSDNEYGLKASLYGSVAILGSVNKKKR